MTLTVKFTSSKTEDILQAEARVRGVTSAALIRAIVNRAVRNGKLNELLAGVDFDNLGRKPRAAHTPRRKPKRYMFDGKECNLVEYATLSGVPYATLYNRMSKYGMTIEQATAAPNMRGVRDGKYAELTRIALEHGMKPSTLKNRIVRSGMTLEEALNRPVDVRRRRK